MADDTMPLKCNDLTHWLPSRIYTVIPQLISQKLPLSGCWLSYLVYG